MPNQFTAEQEEAFGQIVCDHIGGHFQTGLWEHGDPYIYVKMGSNLPVSCYVVSEDGTVLKNPDPVDRYANWDGRMTS